jgi:hypothetical protein
VTELEQKLAKAVVFEGEMQRTQKEREVLTAQLEEARGALTRASGTRTLKWFLTGGVIVLAGFGLGAITYRRKKARTFL